MEWYKRKDLSHLESLEEAYIMVYFLSHRAHRDYPWLNVKRGEQIYKVVADSLNDLLEWGRTFGLTRPHISRSGTPHFDLWGSRLALLEMQGIKSDHKRLYRRRFLRKAK